MNVGRLPIALGFAVMAAVMWLAGTGWWAFIPIAVGLYLLSKVGPRLPGDDRLFSPELRAALLERDGGRCRYCRRPVHYEGDCPRGGCDLDYQADHLVAWADGGRTTLDNGIVACRWCNLHKSARSVVEFLDDPDGDGVPGMA